MTRGSPPPPAPAWVAGPWTGETEGAWAELRLRPRGGAAAGDGRAGPGPSGGLRSAWAAGEPPVRGTRRATLSPQGSSENENFQPPAVRRRQVGRGEPSALGAGVQVRGSRAGTESLEADGLGKGSCVAEPARLWVQPCTRQPEPDLEKTPGGGAPRGVDLQ